MVCLLLALASYIMSVYMMSKQVKLLRLGKKDAQELTTGSLDPAAIADSCLEDLRTGSSTVVAPGDRL